MSKDHLKAKPTSYRRIKLRSRLEARWAVLFDHYFMIQHWAYEPTCITITDKDGSLVDKYTPDFVLTYPGDIQFFVEIKPAKPADEYVENLLEIASLINSPILLCYGEIWHKAPQPSVMCIIGNQINCTGLIYSPWFPSSERALEIARNFRLDLNQDNYKPPGQRGSRKTFNHVMQEWTKIQRRANRENQKRAREN